MTFSKLRIALTLVALLSMPIATALAQPPAPLAASGAASAARAASAASTAGTAGSSRDAARTRRKMNRQLVKRVAAVLARSRGLDSSRILIRAADGVVTLSGTVPDNVQIPLAVSAAQQVGGVTAVRNQLRVGTFTE